MRAYADLFRLDGKIAAIVGAGSGIGEAIAHGLGAYGARVVCLDVDGEAARSVYAATKAAIVQLVRTAATELGPANIRVNAIAPGVVETPLTAPITAHADWYDAYAAKTVLRRWATADEMVGPALFLCSEAASYVTGSLLFADGGWTAADGRFTPPGL